MVTAFDGYRYFYTGSGLYITNPGLRGYRH
ncbi:hypothetical protein QO002_005625 [Pararhizobium capsulatum DSM 1112]|uniref:Uncharacterized protein n=1 Tax=Pararhizobium capsulatum DSM 1112 TaxID=1121113 RepID=A0ABU0BYU3_9HYPH|nr:hypothetical protein [Pararhizobium capsulatum DSM 1112]